MISMVKERFNLRNGVIYDDLTGFHYRNLKEIKILLNQLNERADRNAEMIWKTGE